MLRTTPCALVANLGIKLIYLTLLCIVKESLDDRLKSGSSKIARFKEVSEGQQFFNSDSEMWPMNQAIPKIEGNILEIPMYLGRARRLLEGPHFVNTVCTSALIALSNYPPMQSSGKVISMGVLCGNFETKNIIFR